MSSPVEQPGGTNEPTGGEDKTREGTMEKGFLKEQPEGASEQAWKKGASDSQEQGNPEEISQSGGAGVQQSVATSHLSKTQAAESEIPERLAPNCIHLIMCK